MSEFQAPAAPAPTESAPQSNDSSPQQSSAPESGDIQEQVAEAIDSGASPQEIKSMIREFELTVNGKRTKKKIDLSDESALQREFQIAEANKSGMSKARELEKLFERELTRLKQNPWEVLQEMGHDPYELSEKKLNEWVEQQKKSPEQLQMESMQKELAEARRKSSEREEEIKRVQYEQMKNQAAKEIESEIESSLAGNPNLPKSGKTIGRIVDALQWAYDNGYPEATVKDVIPMVEQDILRETQEFFENMDDNLMEKYLGQKNIEKMRKKRLAQMKQTPSVETPVISKPKVSQTKDKISSRDFFKALK